MLLRMRRMYVAITVYSFGLQLRMYGIHQTHFDHTGLDLLSPVISSHVTQSTAQKEKLYGGFCQAVKKSGGNIEVTVLPRWPYGGFSLYFILLDKGKGIDKCSLYFSVLSALQISQIMMYRLAVPSSRPC